MHPDPKGFDVLPNEICVQDAWSISPLSNFAPILKEPIRTGRVDSLFVDDTIFRGKTCFSGVDGRSLNFEFRANLEGNNQN